MFESAADRAQAKAEAKAAAAAKIEAFFRQQERLFGTIIRHYGSLQPGLLVEMIADECQRDGLDVTAEKVTKKFGGLLQQLCTEFTHQNKAIIKVEARAQVAARFEEFLRHPQQERLCEKIIRERGSVEPELLAQMVVEYCKRDKFDVTAETVTKKFGWLLQRLATEFTHEAKLRQTSAELADESGTQLIGVTVQAATPPAAESS